MWLLRAGCFTGALSLRLQVCELRCEVNSAAACRERQLHVSAPGQANSRAADAKGHLHGVTPRRLLCRRPVPPAPGKPVLLRRSRPGFRLNAPLGARPMGGYAGRKADRPVAPSLAGYILG